MLGPCVIICQLSFPPHMTTSIHHAGRANLSHARDLQVLDQPPNTLHKQTCFFSSVAKLESCYLSKYDESQRE